MHSKTKHTQRILQSVNASEHVFHVLAATVNDSQTPQPLPPCVWSLHQGMQLIPQKVHVTPRRQQCEDTCNLGALIPHQQSAKARALPVMCGLKQGSLRIKGLGECPVMQPA